MFGSTKGKCTVKKSIRPYLLFLLYFEVTLFVIFKVIQVLFPSTLIFDQILIICFFTIALYIYLLSKKERINFDKYVAIVSLGLFLVFLNQTFILNVDRSRSTYVLSWVDKGYVMSDDTGNLFTEGILSKENSYELGTVQRVRENIDRGLMKVDGENVRLTFVGHILLNICEGTANIFDLKGWKMNSR
jgi:hypothetical protein